MVECLHGLFAEAQGHTLGARARTCERFSIGSKRWPVAQAIKKARQEQAMLTSGDKIPYHQ